MKPSYYQSIQKFEASRQQLSQQGISENDLPFLFGTPDNTTGLLMLHGSAASPCNTLELGRQLFQKSYTVLGALLCGHGQGNDLLNSGKIGWKDCYQSAIEALMLLEGMVDKVYVIGSSFGGTLAYWMGVQLRERLTGLVALSAPTLVSAKPGPFPAWIEQIEAAIGTIEDSLHELGTPTLILHSADDKNVKMKHALYAFNTIHSRQKKLIIYNQVGHSLGFGFNTVEVCQDIHQFILTYRQPVRIRFALAAPPGVESVYLAGEFNHWDPQAQPLVYKNGVWECDIPLSPGVYQYKFLLDQQRWVLDPGSETVSNAQGGKNSMIRVS